MAKKIDYKSLLNQNNFVQFLQNIIDSDKNPQIVKAAKEILFEIRGNKNIVKKYWYNALYEKYQFNLQVQLDKPPKNKVILYTYNTIIIPGSFVVTQTKAVGVITIPTPVKATPSYGGLTYKTFEGKTTSNSTVCINGGAEVVYSYTSAKSGTGIVTFYSSVDGCGESLLIPIQACVVSDATSFKLVNSSDLVSGTGPRQDPSSTNSSCDPSTVLLTVVGNTIDSLIISL